MIDLRALLVAVLLACGPGTALAQAGSPLASIDRELNSLCLRLPKASGADAAAARARLVVLWRQRESIFAGLTAEQRTAALRGSSASRECLAMAQQASEAKPRARKAKKRAAFRKGGGGADGALRDVMTRIEPGTAGSQMREMSRGPASVGPATVAPPPDVPSPALEEFFPWPPPAPSDRRLLRLAQLGGAEPLTTWGQVADRMIGLLRGGHYPTWGFYGAPGGFAVIPHIEQIDLENGRALAGDGRWASDVKLASLNFFQRIATVQLPKGLYRVIIFVLTTDPRTGGEVTDPARLLQLAKRWGTAGALDLPESLRGEPVTKGQRFYVVLYEFESEVGGKTTVNTSARWRIEHHLTDAAIVLQP